MLNRVILKAFRGSAPAQINVPRDFWTQVIDIELPQIVKIEHPRGSESAIAEAAKLLSEAKFPVILNGAGVVLSGAIPASRRWPSGWRRRSAATISTMTPSRARTRFPAVRSATTAPRPPWR